MNFIETLEVENRKQALIYHVRDNYNEEIKIEDIEYTEYGFKTESMDFLVLTDSEALRATEEYIKDTLWAFNASFLVQFLPDECKNQKIEKSLSALSEKLCEAANPLFLWIFREQIKDIIREAILSDGRGHFLAGYDGNENEEGNYFIYRVD